MSLARARLHRLRRMSARELTRSVVGRATLWSARAYARHGGTNRHRSLLLRLSDREPSPETWFAIPSPDAIFRMVEAGDRGDALAFFGEEARRHRFHVFGLVGGGAPPVVESRRRLDRLRQILGPEDSPPAVFEVLHGGYSPIDWAVDVRTGYRWPAGRRAEQLSLTPVAGADIKVVWEINRCQHLPMLGLHALCLQAQGKRGEAEAAFGEVVLQMTDWIVGNPPGLGINWRYPMEVALRLWNWLWALAFLRAGGMPTGGAGPLITGSLIDHASFLEPFIRFSPERRHNHYLSYLVGALGAAAWLPETPWTNRLMRHAIVELRMEARERIAPDGSCHERTPAYQRLVTEMFIWAFALSRRVADPRLHRVCEGPAFQSEDWAHLARMVDVLATCQQPDGLSPLFGDCDSARLQKLVPDAVVAGEPTRFSEVPADFRATVAAGLAVLGSQPAERSARYALECDLVGQPAERSGSSGWDRRQRTGTPQTGICSKSPPAPGARPSRRARLRWRLTERGEDAGLSTLELFPTFGLAVLRNRAFWVGVRFLAEGATSGGHMHHDEASFVLSAAGRSVVVDPGSPVYTADIDERNRFRSERVHSRCVAGEPAEAWPAGVAGCFFLRVAGTSRLTPQGHEGLRLDYELAGRPASRTFTLDGAGLVVDDEWHDHDGMAIVCCLPLAERVVVGPSDRHAVRLREGTDLVVAELEGWAARTEAITISPGFGLKRPALAVRLTAKDGEQHG